MIVWKTPVDGFSILLDAPPAASAELVSIVARSGGEPALTAEITVDDGSVHMRIERGDEGESYIVTVDVTTTEGDVRRVEQEIAVCTPGWTMPDGGTGYLTISEFVDIVGLDEAVLMTDRTGSRRIDRDYLVAALRAAQSTVDLNLSARYRLPLAVVPQGVKTMVADLARSRLYPRGAPDGVAQTVKDANALLARISAGTIKLDLPADQPPAEAESDAPVGFIPGHRVYRDDLRGY